MAQAVHFSVVLREDRLGDLRMDDRNAAFGKCGDQLRTGIAQLVARLRIGYIERQVQCIAVETQSRRNAAQIGQSPDGSG